LLGLVAFFGFPFFSQASSESGVIDTTNKYARVLSDNSLINFNTGQSTVTITDTALTGYAWGTNIGWINLAPTFGGVANDGNGNLSGYAWGEAAGWINFNPANGGVTIDSSGDFNGYAWSEKKGWILFNCASNSSCALVNHKVSTNWHTQSSRPECNNGIDDDGDGQIDYPADHDCDSLTDNTERGTGGGGGGGGGGNQPQCSDNRDNDGDSLVDRFDPQCHTDGNAENSGSYSDSIDNENGRPVVALIGDNPLSILLNADFIDPGATAFDPEDGDISERITVTGNVSTGAVGSYVLTYRVRDSIGSESLAVTRVVEVGIEEDEENERPVIELIGNSPIVIIAGQVFTDPGARATDAEDGDITSNIRIEGEVDFSRPGSYVITYRVTDFMGLSAVPVTRIVDVRPAGGDEGCTGENCDGVEDCVGENCGIGNGCTGDDCGGVGGGGGSGGSGIVPQIRDFATSAPTQIITTIGVVTGFLLALTPFFTNPFSTSELFLIPFRIWSWILAFFGLRKRYKPWGTVYDSVTKQPLDPAYVTLLDVGGREVTSSITDLDGRYGFLAEPGTYTLEAKKTHYFFPSEKLSGRSNDELYGNLYFGEPLSLEKNEGVIARNIPMDPIGFDWNEFAKKNKKLMRFYSRFDPIFTRLADVLFFLGFIVAVVAFYSAPYPYNTIIFGFYVLLTILRILGLRPKFYGSIIRKSNGQPLSFAIVRIFRSDSEDPFVSKPCDVIGRYYALVPKGEYYLRVDEKKEDGSYETVYTSQKIYARRGIINNRLVI